MKKSMRYEVSRMRYKDGDLESIPHTSYLIHGTSSRGFTILFAVLIGSILLAVGIAIFDITVRELRLSSIARESQIAVYNADSGAECALYWSLPTQDRVTFSTSSPIII